MHWFWRATIAVFMGNAVGLIGSLVYHNLYLLLRSKYGYFDDFPSLVIPLFTSVTIAALSTYALLPRSDASDQSPLETRCRKCGYILRGITKPRCPECGEKIVSDGEMERQRVEETG